jgi:hypothetical protein
LEGLEDRRLLSTFTVQNLNDSGAGSLRADIAAASSGDTINFASGLSGTITLTSGQLLISDGVTIEGPGASELSISGNNSSRIFEIAAGQNVAISGLTITDGNAGGGDGGGVLNEGMLALTNCTLAASYASNGGGLANDGALTLTDCTISGNTAANGGGIDNVSGATLALTSSTVYGNHANANDFADGGGI